MVTDRWHALGPMPDLRPLRGRLLWLTLAYLAFAVYGSLVPLEFRPVPLDEALARFANIPYLDLGIGSRADWVANILLFIPLAFLGLATIWPSGRPAWGLLFSVLLVTACIALSLGIEFTQIFFPPRTVSRNDILAEGLGALIGVTLWWLLGGRTISWLSQWKRAHGQTDVARQMFWAYLLILFGYNLLPLDLTVSPVEIFHKWREGKLYLVPFLSLAQDPGQLVYDLAIDTLIWAPVTLFWLWRGDKPALAAWRDTVLLALLLEVLQLFVYSRVTDATDLFTAAAGAAVGVAAGRQMNRNQRSTARGNHPLLWWLAVCGWSLLLPAVFWYPFDFQIKPGEFSARLATLLSTPLTAYYYGTEFRAVTEVLHKVGFFAPMGVLLALAAQSAPYLQRVWYAWANPILALAVALGIEIGQLFLPEKYPNLTDVFLEVAGAWLGYASARWVITRMRTPAARGSRPAFKRYE